MIEICVECKNKGDASNNTGNWNHVKILQTILEQHIKKAPNQGTTENRYIGHSIHCTESTNVEVQNSIEDSTICIMNCKGRIAAPLVPLNHGLFQFFKCEYPA
jgi:hypothetical protein